MNESIKRRSLYILDSLTTSADETEYAADELVQMLIRGDDNRQLAPQVRQDVEKIREAVDTIKNCVTNISFYVNRKQETHRL